MFHVPEKYRVRSGRMASDESYGNNGAFMVPFESFTFCVIASDGEGWEHVSVSLPTRTPSWKQMCFIKNLFWDDDDCVVQYHPAKSDYINNHPNCLHIWRPTDQKIPVPDPILVGLKQLNLQAS